MHSRLQDLLLTALGPMLWGTTFLITTTMLPPGRPFLAGTLRALPVGLLIMLYNRRLPTGVWWGRMLLLSLFNITLFSAFLFISAQRIPGGVTATAGALQPMLASLIAWPLLGRRPTLINLVTALVGAAGVAMVVLGPAVRLDTLGVLAALGTCVSMSLGTVLTEKWGRPVPVLLFSAWQYTIGGALLGLLMLTVEGLPVSLSLGNVAGYAYLTLVVTGLGYTLWFRGIGRLGTNAASFLVLCAPIAALVLDIVFLNRSATALQLAGVAIVSLSVAAGPLLHSWSWRPSRTPDEVPWAEVAD